MGDGFNEWIEQLLQTLGLHGFSMLVLTIPLAVLQGFLSLFPFYTLIFIHISALGLTQGLLTSWLSGVVASVVVYLVCKFLFAERFQRRWGHRLEKYEKWQVSFDRYGIWAIILLRTIPVMPNNLISFMSAISPIRTSAYIWSSIIGVLSNIWLFGIFSSSILFPALDLRLLIGTYAAFCLLLLAAFAIHRRKDRRRDKHDGGTPTAI